MGLEVNYPGLSEGLNLITKILPYKQEAEEATREREGVRR